MKDPKAHYDRDTPHGKPIMMAMSKELGQYSIEALPYYK